MAKGPAGNGAVAITGVIEGLCGCESCSEILDVVVHGGQQAEKNGRNDEGGRRVTGGVTKWQCAAFISWRVSPVTRPFLATLRPLSEHVRRVS